MFVVIVLLFGFKTGASRSLVFFTVVLKNEKQDIFLQDAGDTGDHRSLLLLYLLLRDNHATLESAISPFVHSRWKRQRSQDRL